MEKIIMVSNTSWYLYNFRLSIINLFLKNNFEIICIANYDEYSERLKSNGAKFIKSNLQNKGKNPLSDYTYYRFLHKKYTQLNPSLIFHYTIKPNIYGSMAAKKAGIPSIAVVSGAGHAFIKDDLLTAISRKLYTIAAQYSKEIWFVNSEDQELFIKKKIVNIDKTKVLPGEGINTQTFSRTIPYQLNDSFIFLLAGRMLWDKGIGVYVEAARLIKKKHPKVCFQLLGFIDNLNPSAISKKQIEDWVQEGIMEYLGVTDDVKKNLNRVNCFVLPSYYKEGVPKSLLEAASMELPIITTDNVGCREVVENGFNGFLCKIKDSNDLAEKMEMMIKLPATQLKGMGAKGRQIVESRFHEKFVLEYYANAVKKHIDMDKI